MSAISCTPASTKLLMGQEVKTSLRSTRVTSMRGSHSRMCMYLAAVAPPKPAPVTTTRAMGGADAGVAQPSRPRVEPARPAPSR
ncbi:MAG: hypothetical protein RLZZ584_687 [Pseudomonadota bacterium]